MHVGDRILTAILRDQPLQIARPGTFPQDFFTEKVLLLLFFRYFDDNCAFTGNFQQDFFLHLLQHHDSTRLENTAVTALAQNANGMWNTQIAVNRKFR